jgi:hypothetical protein
MNNETGAAAVDFPYEQYRGTEIWEIVDEAISNLMKNQDIAETTRRDYIVGYLCQKLEPLLAKTGS